MKIEEEKKTPCQNTKEKKNLLRNDLDLYAKWVFIQKRSRFKNPIWQINRNK